MLQLKNRIIKMQTQISPNKKHYKTLTHSVWKHFPHTYRGEIHWNLHYLIYEKWVHTYLICTE